jgi:DNA-binding MarR family transcriptional regulator
MTTAVPSAGVDAADIAAIRAFNRFYTARVGALRDGLLSTAHPLPEARILYELGRCEAIDAGDLRRSLELDAGYLSRLLARLQEQGLVARERSAADARRQRVALTERGREAYATLDARSSAEIGALLEGLSTASSTPASTAGTRASRRSSRASSPTTPSATTRAGTPRGSPSYPAAPWAACSACAATS